MLQGCFGLRVLRALGIQAAERDQSLGLGAEDWWGRGWKRRWRTSWGRFLP